MEAKQGNTDQPAPDGGATIEPWVRCLEAAMCRHGVDRMRIDAERTLELYPRLELAATGGVEHARHRIASRR